MPNHRNTRPFRPLWIALIVATILVLIAYALIFWSPGEPVEQGEVVPVPITTAQ